MTGYRIAFGLIGFAFLVATCITAGLILNEVRDIRAELDRHRLALVEDSARERAMLVSDITAKCDFSQSDDKRFQEIAVILTDLSARTRSLEHFTKIP